MKKKNQEQGTRKNRSKVLDMGSCQRFGDYTYTSVKFKQKKI